MTTSSHTGVRRTLACMLLALVPFDALGQVDAPAHLPAIVADETVDEPLFLLRVLEAHYEAWPMDVADPVAFTQAARELRGSALRTRQYIVDHDLDDELASLYTDFIETMDAYRSFLSTIGAIKQDAADQAAQDRFKSGFNAGYSGAVTYGLAEQMDASSGGAAVAALLVSGVSYLWDAYDKAQARDRAEQEAVARAAQLVDDKIQGSLGRAQSVGREMGRKRGWQQHEMGFDLSQEHAKAVQTMIDNGDLKGLLRTAELQVQQRPRDPFVRNWCSLIRGALGESDASELIQCARDSYDAAFLVPPASFYDEYRLQCVALAAYLAQGARSAEIRSGISPHGSTARARYSVLLWRAVAGMVPNDTTGEVQAELAWAFMADNRLSEAHTLANGVPEALKKTPEYAYQYACLMSRMGRLEESLEWLQYAISLGMWDIAHMRADRDLDALRTGKREDFLALTTPQWEWSVTDDWVWDDIHVTNKSAFPLTGVTIHVELVKDGKKTPLPLTAEYIGPGETKKWVDAVNGPSGRWDSGTATLSCDQNR